MGKARLTLDGYPGLLKRSRSRYKESGGEATIRHERNLLTALYYCKLLPHYAFHYLIGSVCTVAGMEVGYSWTQYRPKGRYGGNYEGQLHLNGSAYDEATEVGQKRFMQELQAVIKSNRHILGYLYWDPVMVEQKLNNSWIKTTWAFKKSGNKWYEDGNMVGNTTWFDYEGKALPVFEVIKEDIPETIRGDVNGDGEVNMQDVMFVLQYILKGKFPDQE